MTRATTIDRPRKPRPAKVAAVPVGDVSKPHPGRRMTEQEFVDWCDEHTRAEWVNGEVIVMSPVNFNHADITMFLGRLIADYVEYHDLGTVVGSGVQMRLANIVSRREPDVLFVAKSRMNIVRPTYLDGPPDLVVEIVSPESVARDWRDKHAEYQLGGVKEYWIIDPSTRKFEISTLGRGKKYRAITESDGKVASVVLKRLYVRPAWLWQPKLPKVLDVARELGVR